MLQCPSCRKGGFHTHEAVARHMSQPRSGCSTWIEDTIRMRTCLPEDDPINVDQDAESSTHNDYHESTSHYDDAGEYLDHTAGEGHASSGEFIDVFPGSAEVYEGGYTFLGLFDEDKNSVYRVNNPYYPFSGRKDWEVASWLLRSGLSMGKIDSFLSLDMIKALPLSFCSAKELRGRAEQLPSGPRWMSKVIETSHPTKSPVILYWRDPVECIASILNDPSFRDHFNFTPQKIYSTAERTCRIYSEWTTGDDAWNMQSMLPSGGTLLGTILSSDKTNISALTGDRVAHPLLISLANISMKTRAKMSSDSFLLTALLPVPKYIHKKKRMRGVLEDRLMHECLDIVLEPLKQAARVGVMMSDPSTTLAQLKVVHTRADPLDLEAFFREAQKFRLNGVATPFWRDWILAEPSHFLTPEMLHHIHRQFYDHDARWLINAVGESEIDFRFSILPHITGFRHFHEGISKLKQVTGRCQCDIQRGIIAVSADAAPSAVLTAIRALMDFRYLVQASRIDSDGLERISAALAEFHANKDAIIAAGIRRGKGKKVITNWHIPKLEFMQSIVPSICNTGVPMQWTADATEHAHITAVKDPARSSNNNNYNPQICRHLDHEEKCRRFDLATSLLDPDKLNPVFEGFDEGDNEGEDDEEDIPADLLSVVPFPGRSRPITNYFVVAKRLHHKDVGSIPLPLRTFTAGRTAFHLAYCPSIRTITIDDAALKFGLPDLRPALTDFLSREATHGQHYVHSIGGGRRAGPHAQLPFENLQVWFKVRLQNTDFHEISDIQPAQTLNCVPPGDTWPCGRFDSVVANTEAGFSWPTSGLQGAFSRVVRLTYFSTYSGHSVIQMRPIMRPMGGGACQWRDHFLVYASRFDVVPVLDLATQLHILKRAKRSNGTRLGDVIPLSQIRAPVSLVPRFGIAADNRLTAHNSMEHCLEFWLNKYWNKQLFFSLTT
ncbi:hypothetical protein DEU56DRAFT_873558 [Suillus clintonianus]|uniref:uncharacterized protein n=1 Tax=Suillus clintonianus TaxID=1904413 RepID=UPI001B8736BA|nr:uncharacterized protein DEU56DRAFT_873558 [Suillus clintonianus]KAG2122771.1 hypothetical protein DEU56DRAFT_873558 [Suillus clintonianus]